ncbi:MAG: DUF4340 domain-containing protein [Clostridia bacterium]|nr:DUF4340 domain-containing protein [Clostridia bacterium]
MSDNMKDNEFEIESRVYEVSDEESTIFSAPELHRDKVKKGAKLKKIILSVVALAVVVAIAVTVAVTVPPLLDDSNTSSTDEINPPIVDSAVYEGVNRVVLKRSDTEIEYKIIEREKETQDDSGNTTTKLVKEWALADIDPSLTDYTNIDNTVNSYMEQHYTKKVSDNKNDGNDYGFDKPIYQVDFYKEGSDSVHLSLIIGGENPAKTGRYATTSNDDAVYYIAGISEFYHYQKVKTDFVDPESIPAIAKEQDYSDDNFTEGQLVMCNKLVVSGNAVGDTYVIESQESDKVTTFTSYQVTSPTNRPANDENVGNIVALFSYGIESTGCYSYTVTDQDIKEFGLDKPDFDVTIYVGNIKRSFKATRQSDGNYAVYYEGNKTIMMVPASSLAPAAYERGDLFNALLFIENITNAESITFQSGAESIVFDITTEYDEEADTNRLVKIEIGGKELKKENFQSFYQYLISIKAQSYDEHDTSALTPDTTIVVKHKDGSPSTTVKYFKITNARYQMEVNGVKMGLISSSEHSRIMKYARNTAADKDYNAR